MPNRRGVAILRRPNSETGEKMSIGAKELAWRIQLQRSQRGLGEDLEQYVDRLYLLAHQAYP